MAITKVFGSVLADVEFSGDSLKIPVGTTSQRPSSAANGMIRYNTTTNEFEIYANGAWKSSTLASDSSIAVITGNTANRSSSPVAGMFRFNTDESNFEGYDGNFWGQIGGAAKVEFYNTSGVRSLIGVGAFSFYNESGTYVPITTRNGNVPFILADGTDTYLKVN
tara:strand:- start:575 stop:1069 length:495 start_codon:yes stop_codon:yes gene_type:complete